MVSSIDTRVVPLYCSHPISSHPNTPCSLLTRPHPSWPQISSTDIKQRLDKFVTDLQFDASLTEEEKALKVKEEKMRIAVEKMKIANKKQVWLCVCT